MVKAIDFSSQTTLVSNFIANVVISGALNYLWGMINCLQIVAHFPMINVLMPANCQLLFTIVVKVATFDMIPVDGLMDKINKFIVTDKDSYKMQNNF